MHFHTHQKLSDPIHGPHQENSSWHPPEGCSNSTAQGRGKAKPAAGSRKPPLQRLKRKNLDDPDHKDPDYVELRRGRSRTETNKDSETAAERPKRTSPRKDSMGFMNPDEIDPDASEDEYTELDRAPFESSNTNKQSRSPIAIVKRFLQRSAEEAVQQQLAGVYASLVGPPNPPDPRNIPAVATAAAATTDEVAYDGLGIGDDDYVVEQDVEQYNEFGIIKSNINYDDDSDFADEEPPSDMSYYRETNDLRGRNLTRGGPQRPDTSGMTKAGADAEIKKWRKARKKYTDGLLAAKAKLRKSLENDKDEYDDAIVYLGVSTPFLRPMSAVESQPMCVDHTYPSKEVLLLRIAEEANLHNIEVANVRSCNKRVYYDGRGGGPIQIQGTNYPL